MSFLESAVEKSRGLPSLSDSLPFPTVATATRTVALGSPIPHTLSEVWTNKAPAAILNHFREIRRGILVAIDKAIQQGRSPVVLVTSPLPGDGKTFVAASIARTFAGAPDLNITLLDMDLMRTTVSRLFNSETLPGVSDCLQGRAELRNILCATDIPRLGFIPAGARASNNREIFVGAQVDSLFARMRTAGVDHLHIIDAPPVIPVVEAAMLAAKVDLVVMVVRAGVTPRAAVDAAIERMGTHTQVSLVLNGVVQRAMSHNYDDAYEAYG
jgi:capsular exopolysaccharide synthesis family protein